MRKILKRAYCLKFCRRAANPAPGKDKKTTRGFEPEFATWGRTSANRKGSKESSLLTSLAMIAALIVTGSLVSPPAFAAETETVPPQMSYLMFCAGCHGTTGDADGPTAASLSVKPRNFTDCAAMSKISDDTIFKVIKYGGASAGLSSEMPGWAAGMDDDEIKGLAKYVRSFCKR